MKKVFLRFVLPILVSGMVIGLFFRDISLDDILTGFLRLSPLILGGFVVLSLVGTVLRAVRYHILLSGQLPFLDVFLITLVRNFAVDLLPARSAALLFYSALTRKKGIALEEGASSFVVSVFYDGLALSFMLGGLAFLLSAQSGMTAIYWGVAVLFLISVGVLFLSERILALCLGFGFLGRFPRLTGALAKVLDYLSRHKNPGERIRLFLLSFAIRLIKYVFVYLLFEGVVRMGWGIENFALFCFGLAGAELSSLLPIQGLGGFGTWELAFAVVFRALQIPAENIREAGFVIHITTQAWEYAIGLVAFLILALGRGSRKAEAPSGDAP